MSKPKFMLSDARKVAAEIMAHLKPHVHEMEVVGSVRRLQSLVTDVEILVRPRTFADGLFGEDYAGKDDVKSEVKRKCDELMQQGILRPRMSSDNLTCWGEKNLRAWTADGFPLDIFSVFPNQSYGVKKAIYTGPAAFSKMLVTPKIQGGYLQIGQKIEGGNLIDRGQVVRCDTEEQFFMAIELAWIPPEARK